MNGQDQTGGLWSAVESAHHINYLELLAVLLALKSFEKDLHSPSQVRQYFHSDLHQSKRGAHSK